MCDKLKPECCVTNASATKAGCIASGGSPSSDPCNILNPISSANSCAASTVVQSSGKLTTVGIIGIVIAAVVIIMGLIYVFTYSGSSSYGGGSRKLNVMKSFRGIKWK